jgi:hypothetical protein
VLVQPDYVVSRIAEACRHFGRIGPDGLDNFASGGDYHFACSGQVVDHDVDSNPGFSAAGRPKTQVRLTSATPSSNANASVATPADVPTEDPMVEPR